MVDYANMNPQLLWLLDKFKQQFPDVEITSGYRSPEYNAAVGGARGSQHIHGNAFDYSVKGLDDQKQAEIANWLRSNGANGFGYYPGSQSMHADLGSPRYWGPNYHATSLNQTPEWFQKFAGGQPSPQVVAQATPQAPAPTPVTPATPGIMAPSQVPPTIPRQPGVMGTLQAGTPAGWTQTIGLAPTTANTMGNIGGLLTAMLGGGQQKQVQAPQGYEHRPDDPRKYEDLFSGLLA